MAIWQGFDADKDLERITKVIQPYEERIAALTAELEAVRRDAERYRWLCEGENASVRLLHLPPSGVGWPKTLDEAIDAARQQEGKDEG